MALWMIIYDTEGANTKPECKGRDGESLVKMYKCQNPFRFHFSYHYQLNDHNNRRHSTISLDRKWDTKFWPDRNFAW